MKTLFLILVIGGLTSCGGGGGGSSSLSVDYALATKSEFASSYKNKSIHLKGVKYIISENGNLIDNYNKEIVLGYSKTSANMVTLSHSDKDPAASYLDRTCVYVLLFKTYTSAIYNYRCVRADGKRIVNGSGALNIE